MHTCMHKHWRTCDCSGLLVQFECSIVATKLLPGACAHKLTALQQPKPQPRKPCPSPPHRVY